MQQQQGDVHTSHLPILISSQASVQLPGESWESFELHSSSFAPMDEINGVLQICICHVFLHAGRPRVSEQERTAEALW